MFNNSFGGSSLISLFANLHRISNINVIGIDVVGVESSHLERESSSEIQVQLLERSAHGNRQIISSFFTCKTV